MCQFRLTTKGPNVYRSYDTLGRLYGQWVCNGPANPTCSGGTQI